MPYTQKSMKKTDHFLTVEECKEGTEEMCHVFQKQK